MSCNRFVEVWGSAAGPVKVLGPATRLLTGGLLFASVLASDPATATGFVFILAITSIWFVSVKPPSLLIGPLLLFAFTLFGPFFLLTPWVQTPTAAGVDLLIPMPWAVAWRIGIKGIAALLISAWTASTLGLHEFEIALVRLRIPKPLAELLLQIVHQAHALAEETRAISQAIRVRGASMGWRSVIVLATALPRVWLPRVLYRAERVGDAMEIRDYELNTDITRDRAAHPAQPLAITFGIGAFLVAILVRVAGS